MVHIGNLEYFQILTHQARMADQRFLRAMQSRFRSPGIRKPLSLSEVVQGGRPLASTDLYRTIFQVHGPMDRTLGPIDRAISKILKDEDVPRGEDGGIYMGEFDGIEERFATALVCRDENDLSELEVDDPLLLVSIDNIMKTLSEDRDLLGPPQSLSALAAYVDLKTGVNGEYLPLAMLYLMTSAKPESRLSRPRKSDVCFDVDDDVVEEGGLIVEARNNLYGNFDSNVTVPELNRDSLPGLMKGTPVYKDGTRVTVARFGYFGFGNLGSGATPDLVWTEKRPEMVEDAEPGLYETEATLEAKKAQDGANNQIRIVEEVLNTQGGGVRMFSNHS